MRIALMLFLGGAGCLGASSPSGGGDADADTDADGDVLDADGDGWNDDVEVASYTDPADALDHPYEFGDYPMDACRNDVVSTGVTPGDVAPNFEMPDQFGQAVHLHDFCDHIVVLTIGAFWCAPCAEAAAHLREMYDELGDVGFFPIDISAWAIDGDPCTVEDLANWAEQYDLNTPVLWDDTFNATGDYMAQGNGLPHRVLIAPGMQVVEIGVKTEDEIRAWVLEVAGQ